MTQAQALNRNPAPCTRTCSSQTLFASPPHLATQPSLSGVADCCSTGAPERGWLFYCTPMNLIWTFWVLSTSATEGCFCLWIQMPRSTSESNGTLASPPCCWFGGRCPSPCAAGWGLLCTDSWVLMAPLGWPSAVKGCSEPEDSP